MPDTTTRKWTFRRLARMAAIILLFISVTIAIFIAIGYCLLTSPPEFWEEYDVTSPESTDIAIQFENRIPTQLTAARKDNEIWQLTLAQNEINAWITTRLPHWMRSQRDMLRSRKLPSRMPNEIKHTMVAIKSDSIIGAVEIEYDDQKQIVSVDFTPFMGPNGVMRLEMGGIKGGRLLLPRAIVDMLIKRLGSKEKVQELAIKKAQKKFHETDLILPIDNGIREIRILDIALSEKQIVLTLQTCITIDTD